MVTDDGVGLPTSVDFLGPFPVGKSELDGDPVFAKVGLAGCLGAESGVERCDCVCL